MFLNEPWPVVTGENDERILGKAEFIKGHPQFESAVKEAIQTWRFRPFQINGQSVGTYTLYKFVFKLR